jgi:hypothetical protein
LILPPEVRDAASLLMTWTLDEALELRAAEEHGPRVVLCELVGSVCEYFLLEFKC